MCCHPDDSCPPKRKRTEHSAPRPNAHGGDGPPRKISTGTLPATFTPPFCWAFSRCAQEFILSAETPPPHHPTATQKPRRHKARSTPCAKQVRYRTSRTCQAKPGPYQVRCRAQVWPVARSRHLSGTLLTRAWAVRQGAEMKAKND
jgi:hypothetical protein